MEQESLKNRKPSKGFLLKRFLSVVYFVTIVCILSCIVFQFISFVSIKRQLADVKSELEEIRAGSDEEQSGNLDVKRPLARYKRATNQQSSLSGLDKRIITLEIGYGKDNIRRHI